MFVRAQEQLTNTTIGTAALSVWSCDVLASTNVMAQGFGYQGSARIAPSSRNSKRFAHTSKGLRGLCAFIAKAPARLGNPEDRP